MMRILYRNPDNQCLSVTNVTSTKYQEEDELLTFFGDDDICVPVSREQADILTRTLYQEEKLDLTSYSCIYYEWPDDEYDIDDEDEDEDDEDFLSFDDSDIIIKI